LKDENAFEAWLLARKDRERVSVLVLSLAQGLEGGGDLSRLPGELLGAAGRVGHQRPEGLGPLLLLHLESGQPVVEGLETPRLLLSQRLRGRQPVAEPLQRVQHPGHCPAVPQTVVQHNAVLSARNLGKMRSI